MVWMRKEGDWGEEGHWSLVFRKLWGADGLFFFYSTHRETAVNAGTEVLRGHGIVPFVPFFSEAEPWTREQALQWQQLPHHSAKMIKEQMSPCHSLQAPSLHLYTHIIQPSPHIKTAGRQPNGSGGDCGENLRTEGRGWSKGAARKQATVSEAAGSYAGR